MYVPDAHTVLDQPFVDGLRGVGHEDASPEVCLGHDVG